MGEELRQRKQREKRAWRSSFEGWPSQDKKMCGVLKKIVIWTGGGIGWACALLALNCR